MWIANPVYGTIYTIRVASFVNGNWTLYGPSCTVTTPALPPSTQLNLSSCGITETTLNQYLYCYYVPAATEYRYEITDQSSSSVYYTNTNTNTHFNLMWISNPLYGTTYSIRVASYVNGSWTAYGTACNVTTPASPKPGREEELTGIKNNSGNTITVNFYPNPTEGRITFDLGLDYATLNVLVSNSIGQELLTKEYRSTRTFELNLDVIPGIYFVTIRTDKNEVKKVKVIKQ